MKGDEPRETGSFSPIAIIPSHQIRCSRLADSLVRDYLILVLFIRYSSQGRVF